MKSKLFISILFMLFSNQSFANTKLDTLFSKINERMGYMEDVALYKAQHQLAIEDLDREKVVLSKAKTSSEKFLISSESIEDFTTSMMSAAKAIQYRYRANLLSHRDLMNVEPRDLKNEVRPALIKLGIEINSSIYEYLKDGSNISDSSFSTFSKSIQSKYLTEEDKIMVFKSLQKVKVKR